MKKVKRAEIHQITKNHKLYEFCDRKSFESKNLYNSVNYILRQRFTDQKGYNKKDFNSNYYNLITEFRKCEAAEPLASDFFEGILKNLSTDWKSFFRAIKDWNKNKNKYKAQPNLPGYALTGESGRKTAVNRKLRRGKNGKFKFAGEPVYFKPQTKNKLKQARIVPKPNGKNVEYYNLEIVYEKEVPETNEKRENIAGIDLGKDRLATVVNNIGEKPFAINGKPINSINAYFNKKRAKYMSYVDNRGTSNKIKKLTRKRNNKIKYFFHNVSRYIVDWCHENDIDTLVIGKNKKWKAESNMGKKNNQNWVSIPHNMLVKQIEYKCEDIGIEVLRQEESYTSKASFLDNDEIPVYKSREKNSYEFSGKRIKRGLYKASDGTIIHADLNGAYNIVKKKLGNVFNKKIYLHPEIININN